MIARWLLILVDLVLVVARFLLWLVLIAVVVGAGAVLLHLEGG